MTRTATLLLLALLAGCGAGAGTTATLPTGILAGVPFTPLDGAAFSTQLTCGVGAGALSTSRLAVTFAARAGVCGLAQQSCFFHANDAEVGFTVTRARTDGGVLSPILPGTYPLGTPGGAADPESTTMSANHVRTDATCTYAITSAVTGELRIDAVTSSRVAGHVVASFADGSSIDGNFDVPACAATPSCELCTQDRVACAP